MGAEPPRLSVVVVIWNEREKIERSLPPLVEQLSEGDELVIVDNASRDGGPEMVEERWPEATVIRTGENLGFAPACNLGAERARGDLLLFLNPDAAARPGFVEAIKAPLADGRGWLGWMGLVTSDDGATINTDGNLVHFTGLSWAGGAGEPIAEARREPGQVAGLSGACLAVPKAVWDRVGAFPPEYFIYQEDLDVTLRIRLEGGEAGIETGAVVDHDYEFTKGAAKWRRLERNRWAVVIRTYPGPLLALVFPALVATELGMLPISAAGGWLRQKLLANLDVMRWLPRLLRERREIQSRRTISSGEFARWLTPDLTSTYFGRAGRLAPLRWGLRAYWSVVTALLGARSGSDAGAEARPSRARSS